jgi:hypothetical protein
MFKKFKNLLLFICFVSTSTYAQKVEFDGSFILFREAKTKEPVLIINDSFLYKGVKSTKLPFKHSDYPEKLQQYIPFNIKDKTYLVHSGCGPVLEFRNDSIVRINEAYLQRNQFGAVHFVYNNEIYFFGGYGLFTTKNILTKYIFKTKDWIEVQTHGEKVQEPRSGAYSYLKGDDLYVFGGGAKDEINFTNSKQLDNKVWRLHLPTMQWDCVGKYDQNLLKIGIGSIKSNLRKLHLQDNYFFEIDYYHNTLNIYNKNNFNGVLSSYMEGKKIIGVFMTSSLPIFHVSDISEFKGKLKSTTVFISPLVDYKYYVATSSTSLLVLILLLYLFRKQLMAIVKPFKGIVYKQKKQVFFHKGKPIPIFDDQDKKVLFYLLEHLDQYVSLNELNQLFENNGIVETFSATIKRREQAVSGLLAKVSKITGIEEKELVIERKNAEDKRIKDILLLPNLLKKV